MGLFAFSSSFRISLSCFPQSDMSPAHTSRSAFSAFLSICFTAFLLPCRSVNASTFMLESVISVEIFKGYFALGKKGKK